MVIHLMSRLDIDLQRRCGCAETGGKAAGPRSRPRNITSGNRPLVEIIRLAEGVVVVDRCGKIRGAGMAEVANANIRWECALGRSNRARIYDLRVRCRDDWIRMCGDVRRVASRTSISVFGWVRLPGFIHLCRPTTRVARMHASVYRRPQSMLCCSL